MGTFGEGIYVADTPGFVNAELGLRMRKSECGMGKAGIRMVYRQRQGVQGIECRTNAELIAIVGQTGLWGLVGLFGIPNIRSGTNALCLLFFAFPIPNSKLRCLVFPHSPFRLPHSKIRHPSSVVCPLSSVVCLLSSVICHLSSVLCLPSSVFCPLSSVFCPLSSVICNPTSNFRFLISESGVLPQLV